MTLLDGLKGFGIRLETALVGTLPRSVRHSMYIDLRGASVTAVLSAIFTFIPIILRRQGASDGQIALYYAVSALGLVTTGFSIWLSRRLGTIRVAMASWLVGRSSIFLGALAFSPISLISILGIFFVLEAWPSPAYVHALQIIYPANQRGRIIGLTRVGMTAVILVFTPIAGWILDRFGFRVLLPIAGLSGVLGALSFWPVMRTIPEPPIPAEKPGSPPWRRIVSDRPLMLYLAGTMLFGLGVLISVPLFPSVQVDRLNLSYTVVGLLGFVQSGFWLLGYLFGGRLLDRIRGIRSFQLVCLVEALAVAPYIFAANGWTLVPAFMAAGIVAAGADLATLYTLIDLAGPERTAEYTAINAVVSGVRGLAAPFFGPLLLQAGWSLGAVFGLCAALTVAGAGVLAFIRQSQPPQAGNVGAQA